VREVTGWELAALANVVIMAAYLAISFTIARGLGRSQQWRNNRLGTATAAIFFTCAVHHGYSAHLLLSSENSIHGPAHGGLSATFHAAWDIVTASVGVWYWTLRSRFPALVRGAAVFEDLKLREAVEQTLRESEERYRGIVETTSEGVALIDRDGLVGYANTQFGTMLGRSGQNMSGTSFAELATTDDQAKVRHELDELARSGGTRRFEAGLCNASQQVCAQVALTARFDAAEGFTGTLAMVADVTEQKNVEAQLRQAQRLDALGQLAGGVAHDFNNLLTVIDGYAAMLLVDIDGDARRDLVAIREAAARATALTRQLLAFSRTQTTRSQTVDVNELVAGIEGMLHRLIREDVELVVAPAAEPATVWADRGLLEQVLINLAVNSRDAMPDGGELTIGTAFVDVDARLATQLGGQSGGHVLIKVADTGCGMTADVMARIFEPFFTTKEQGKGAGLGLSTAYGIIHQAKGHILVDSEPGAGTTFRVYLPAASADRRDRAPDLLPDRLAGGTETILLAEDDAAVRALTERILRTAGYQVLPANSGRDAVSLAAEHPTIDLLLTDVIMPGMNGQQLADNLTALIPGLAVVFTSAYTRGVLAGRRDDPSVAYLDKPFTAAALTEKVRTALDSRRRPAAPAGPNGADRRPSGAARRS
jgi:PAS domain S-box-containing protein